MSIVVLPRKAILRQLSGCDAGATATGWASISAARGAEIETLSRRWLERWGDENRAER